LACDHGEEYSKKKEALRMERLHTCLRQVVEVQLARRRRASDAVASDRIASSSERRVPADGRAALHPRLADLNKPGLQTFFISPMNCARELA